MSFSVMTNANAMAALASLNKTQQTLTQTQNRISSGFKIGGAADNASTFSIAQGMRGDISGLSAVSDSLSMGQSVLTVALTAAQSISDALTDLKNKAVAGQDATADKAAIQKDITAKIANIDATANAAQFNGVNLLSAGGGGLTVISSLNRTSSTAVSVATLNVGQQDLTTAGGNLALSTLDVTSAQNNQASFTLGGAPSITAHDVFALTSGTMTYDFEFIDTTAPSTLSTTADSTHTVFQVNFDSGTDNTGSALSKAFAVMAQQGFSTQVKKNGDFVISGNTVSAATYTKASGGSTISASATMGSSAVDQVENAINSVKGVLATLGAFQNQLKDQSTFVKSLSDTLSTGVGNLVDADMAQESANLQAQQTRQQLGIQALSIANQGPGAVLSLFR
jgi:flagellin